jgi:3-oxoacyl-[acyl-carrier-protein] synthase II
MKSNTWVITGTGVVSAIGVNARAHYEALTRGDSCLQPMEEDSAGATAERVVSQGPPVSVKLPPNTTPGTQRLIAAAEMAAKEAQLLERVAAEEVGVVMGTCYGNLRSVAAFQRDVQREGPRFVMPTHFPSTVISTASGQVAIPWRFTGINTTVSVGRASGLEVLATAAELLGTDQAPAILCCGYEELSDELIAAYRQTGCVAVDRQASIPFHPESQGLMLGEAAAVLVLEPFSQQAPRPLAEFAGYGSAFVSKKDSAATKVAAQIHAMREALADADVSPEEISLVLASANGQSQEDHIEASALAEVFGPGLARLPVMALKSFSGECFAATGLVQVALAALLLSEDCQRPQYLVLENHGGSFVAQPKHSTLEEQPRTILINAFDVVGVQSSVVMKRTRAFI